MKFLSSALFVAVLGATSMSAQASLELVDKNACLNCHSVDKKLVGPAFKDVAAKYKDRKDAPAYLAEKLTRGSTGVWGQIPMPGMPQLAADDVKTMVAWILKQP
jgi:cytochrome c